MRIYEVPAPTRCVTVPRARPKDERIPSVILGTSTFHSVRDRAVLVPLKQLPPRAPQPPGASDAYVPAPPPGTALAHAHGAPVTIAGAAPAGKPPRTPVAPSPASPTGGTTCGIPYNASESSPASTSLAMIPQPPGWVTIPPPSDGGSNSLLDHFAAAGWITSRAPLTRISGGWSVTLCW